jgi:hypothetical protein
MRFMLVQILTNFKFELVSKFYKRNKNHLKVEFC